MGPLLSCEVQRCARNVEDLLALFLVFLQGAEGLKLIWLVEWIDV